MPANKKRRPRYPKALSQPIDLRDSPGISPCREEFYLRDQRFQKLDALLKFYNLDYRNQDCWFLLSSKLAEEHVPGFKVVSTGNKRGRKKEQTLINDLDLIIAVEDKAAIGRKGIKWACTQLVKTLPYSKFKTATTLSARYYEAKKRHPDVDKLIAFRKNRPDDEYFALAAYSIIMGQADDN